MVYGSLTPAVLPPTCWVRLLTPKGHGGVAVLEFGGPGTLEFLSREFVSVRKQGLGDGVPQVNRLRFGRFGPPPGEESVLCQTANNCWELHCHGGPAVVDWLVSRFVQNGYVHLPTFEMPASSLREEVLQAAAHARTETVAAWLFRQLADGLASALSELIENCLTGQAEEAQRLCQRLLATRPLGDRLTKPWRLVLVGPVNVGKSSLMNALAGFQRSIVSDQPGTTLDVLQLSTAFQGWPVDLLDTAGKRLTAHPVERQGQELGQAAADQAEILLEVAEAQELLEPGVKLEIPVNLGDGPARGSGGNERPCQLRIYNKQDLSAYPAGWYRAPDGVLALLVSARTGAGLEALLAWLGEQVVPPLVEKGPAVTFTDRQRSLLQTCSLAVHGGDLPSAAQAVRQIMGPSERTW